MAISNRTFKAYGQAYAPVGDVSVVLKINNISVFSGAVADSSTVRTGPPTIENLLFQFELPKATIGAVDFSLAVTGGELCLGPISYNGLDRRFPGSIPTPAIPFNPYTVENQLILAGLLQGLVSAECHAALLAGQCTSDTGPYEAEILAAWRTWQAADKDWEYFQKANFSEQHAKQSASLAGGSADPIHQDLSQMNSSLINKAAWWPIIESGETFACTWTIDTDPHAS